jgi:hypothetical protein
MNTSFFDTKFFINSLITFGLSALILVCCYTGPTVHLPFLTAMLGALYIGFLEPKRGWALAIIMTLLVLAGGFLMKSMFALTVAQAERTQFVAYLAFFPVFTGSFLGGFVKRALG